MIIVPFLYDVGHESTGNVLESVFVMLAHKKCVDRWNEKLRE